MAEQNSFGSISIIGSCIVIVIGLQAATLHRLYFEFNDNEGSQNSASVQLPLQDKLRQRFPGMFQNESEIMKRVRLWIAEAAANTSADAPIKVCIANYCTITLPTILTSCCKIVGRFETVTTAIDIDSVNRTLAQFGDHKQYFFTENFTQLINPSCNNCRCTALTLYSIAVYVIDEASDQYDVGFFKSGAAGYSLTGGLNPTLF